MVSDHDVWFKAGMRNCSGREGLSTVPMDARSSAEFTGQDPLTSFMFVEAVGLQLCS
jgi:hypothetical protein